MYKMLVHVHVHTDITHVHRQLHPPSVLDIEQSTTETTCTMHTIVLNTTQQKQHRTHAQNTLYQQTSTNLS